MSLKYHVATRATAPRFEPVSRYNAMENEGCLGCRICVKRTSCVYDVYGQREFNPTQAVDTTDVLCINCMRCVQECKKNILARAVNPQYLRLGNGYWTPAIIDSIWKQSATGSIPVSGAGYRGPFAGPGFDSMWTDMSEIVRPTRDGIHGREYISTLIELGRRPDHLAFDESGRLVTQTSPFIEIPVPLVLQVHNDYHFVQESTKRAIAGAGKALGTLTIMRVRDALRLPEDYRNSVAVDFDPGENDPEALRDFVIARVPYSGDVADVIRVMKRVNPDLIVAVGFPLDEHAAGRAVELASAGVEVLHVSADTRGGGLGLARGFLVDRVQDVHAALLEARLRDRVSVLAGGGIAMAEHVAKTIACGADGVVLELAPLVAMECRLCRDCHLRTRCPVDLGQIPEPWGIQRIVNLVGSWHSQLLEVMGAMGLRDARLLRGEKGRLMFFRDLEDDVFRPLFGARRIPVDRTLTDAFSGSAVSAKQDVDPASWTFPGGAGEPEACPSRFRNSLGIYKVVRTSDCIGCGRCAEVCQYGVHVKAGTRMLAPRSHLCRGFDVCRGEGSFCINHCPVDAIRIGLDPMWQAFGDPRWTADLLSATWKQAETGRPPRTVEYKVGASGGGFDRINILVRDGKPAGSARPEDVDLGVRLNRRSDDGRPDVTIGIPFYGGGMSFGSIGLETMLARAQAYTAFHSFTCTGEGGFPEALEPYDEHVITQVATGLFGVREETIQRVRMVEFKYAQGAKPGLGGHLLGGKNTPAVAKMREAVQGFPLFSPFPFHSVYSVEDHKKHVDWIKEVNPRAIVSVKVSGASDVDMVAVGSYYAGAHVVHLDGSYGGTGAAPDIAKKNIAMPIEYAVPKVHRFLREEGVRDQITLVASGGIRTAWDLAKIIALGANAAVIGTAEMVSLECIRCGACESGRGCARGIATTDPELSVMYTRDWAAQRLKNLFHSWAVELQNILWRLGMRSVDELVGRSDVLEHLDYRGPATETGE